MRIKLTDLPGFAGTRGEAFARELEAAGTAVGDELTVTDEDWLRLIRLHRPVKPPAPALGLGDLVERLAKPVARALKLDCLDEKGGLKPASPCGKRKAWLNRVVPNVRPPGPV